jgi:hypothetical protein
MADILVDDLRHQLPRLKSQKEPALQGEGASSFRH